MTRPDNLEGVARRAKELYNRDIRARVEPSHVGEFVVVDVDSGDFEVDRDQLRALDRLMARRADAVPFLLRAGFPTAVRLGARAAQNS